VLRVDLGVDWVGVAVDIVGEFFIAVFCDLAIIFCMSWPPFGSVSLDALFGGIVDSCLEVLPAVITLENYGLPFSRSSITLDSCLESSKV
jgi:hypothetical protein